MKTILLGAEKAQGEAMDLSRAGLVVNLPTQAKKGKQGNLVTPVVQESISGGSTGVLKR